MSADDTKGALVAAAERLFAERGIDGPSLREITREADQRNTAALQYHFGGRDELLTAILDKHSTEVDAQRRALLDSVELSGVGDGRLLAAALVVPAVAKLDDPDGGPEYLQIVGEMVLGPRRFARHLGRVAETTQMNRWSLLVGPLLPAEALGRPLHRRSAAFRFVHGELAGRARERADGDHRLFANHLVDVALAMLQAPVSAETRALLRADAPSTKDAIA